MKRGLVGVAATGLIWAVVGLPFAGASHDSSLPTYTGCLKKGKVSKLQAGDEPAKPCVDGKETKVHLSGGDITAVTAGTGMSGGGTTADITLAILPSFRLPQGCAVGQIASFDGTGWSCASDMAGLGDITGVTAGTGLSGGGSSGEVSLDLATSFRLPQSCASGDFVTWTGSSWGCASVGDITGVTAGTGLTGGGTSGNATLNIASSYRLPQSCANSQIAEWSGTNWVCGTVAVGRVASDTVPPAVTLTSSTTDIATLTITPGSATGGTAFVKVDAAFTARISSTTGCPCHAMFFVSADGIGTSVKNHFATLDSVAPSAAFGGLNRGFASGALTEVFPVPTGVSRTIRLKAKLDGGTGTVLGSGSMTAIYVPFGASGGSTLS